MLALYVAIGGAIGSVARYLLMGGIGRWWKGDFPLSTLAVNIAGSFAMGMLVGGLARSLSALQPEMRVFVGVGLLGGFTTFSAFSLDAVTLIEQGHWGLAVSYALLSVALSVLGLFAGLWLMRLGSA